MLQELGYDQSPDPADAAAGGGPVHRAALLQLAAGFSQLFQLVSTDAPGLVFVGAQIGRGASASGSGTTLQAAFQGCVGEAAEYLSQWEAMGDVGLRAPWRTQAEAFVPATARALGALLDLGQADGPGPVLDWVAGRRLSDGAPAWVPADLCLRRDPAAMRSPAAGPLSIGCAAGVSLQAATLHGLLETIERDAVALWWNGGRPGRRLPPAHPVAAEAARLLGAIRAQDTSRTTWLLDITTDLGVPCVAAVSCDADRRGVAAGFASRLTVGAAVRAALMELCQMELAGEIARTRRDQRGEAALGEVDRAHLRRATELDVGACSLLHPLDAVSATADITAAHLGAAVNGLVQRLADCGVEAFAIDLTRATLSIPVAFVLCPRLERAPSQHVGDRLRATRRRTGAAPRQPEEVSLL